MVLRKKQIGRAGFTHHRQPMLPCILELIHLSSHVHMDQVQGCSGLGCQGCSSQGGLYFAPGWARACVPFGRVFRRQRPPTRTSIMCVLACSMVSIPCSRAIRNT
jgi:hypothetical protein